jgi:hypothetical protein
MRLLSLVQRERVVNTPRHPLVFGEDLVILIQRGNFILFVVSTLSKVSLAYRN